MGVEEAIGGGIVKSLAEKETKWIREMWLELGFLDLFVLSC